MDQQVILKIQILLMVVIDIAKKAITKKNKNNTIYSVVEVEIQ